LIPTKHWFDFPRALIKGKDESFEITFMDKDSGQVTSIECRLSFDRPALDRIVQCLVERSLLDTDDGSELEEVEIL
jgi:hypothetical protein